MNRAIKWTSASVEVEPPLLLIEKRVTQRFGATGFDRYGNEIPGLGFDWDTSGGYIDRAGLFTASGQNGRYQVRAQATQDGQSAAGVAEVDVPPIWLSGGSMLATRSEHTATVLPDGKVLIVGGAEPTAELYDPATHSSSIAGVPVCGNTEGAEATLLSDGRVLMTGGTSAPDCAEIYDPETVSFSEVGGLNVQHWEHTATLLTDGRVLVAGGYRRGADGALASSEVAEIYDPVTATFSLTGSLNAGRFSHAAVSLPTGDVLITGGCTLTASVDVCIGTAELYDHATGTFRAVAGGSFRGFTRATLLNDGRVLVTSEDGQADLFDPARESFRSVEDTTTNRSRNQHAATVLPSGRVLITGGTDPDSALPLTVAAAEVYDPATETFAPADGMSEARQQHTATVLRNGSVLVLGGRGHAVGEVGERLSSAERWIPSRAIDAPAGLVSWWPGDANARDVVGLNDGTPDGEAGFANGMVGQAFSFDGIDGVVSAPAFRIGDLQQLTIDFWVKLDSLPDRIQRFVSLTHEKAVLRHDGQAGPGQLHFFMTIGGEHHHIRVSGVLEAGEFHHVAGTYDGTRMRLYLDGEEVRSLAHAGRLAVGGGVELGGRSTISEPLDGLLDEVTVFDRALSAGEIKAIYDAGSAGKARPTPTPTPTLAVMSDRDGDFEIYVIDSDGSNVTQLTLNESRDGAPIWSPNGKQIAFNSELDGDWDIYVMDADGGNLTQLTFNETSDFAIRWSPKGRLNDVD